jgi:hypothetical protein
LARRLSEVGLDPVDFGDPSEAWRRLHARFGRRATLIDRYALEVDAPPDFISRVLAAART